MSLTVAIALFLAVDAVVVFLVVRRAMRRAGAAGPGLANLDFARLARFSSAMHEEAGRYLEAHYGGDPALLPEAMRGLLGLARSRAEQEGLALDDATLRKVVETSARRHRVARGNQIRAALDRAA